MIVCDQKSPDHAGDVLESLMKSIEEKVTEIYRRVHGSYAISMFVFVLTAVFLNSIFVCCIHKNFYVCTFQIIDVVSG